MWVVTPVAQLVTLLRLHGGKKEVRTSGDFRGLSWKDHESHGCWGKPNHFLVFDSDIFI